MKEDLLINVSSPGIVSRVSAHAPCFISSFYVMHAIYNLGKAGRNHELCPCCMIFMATMTDRQRYKIYSLVPHVFNAACNNKNMGVAWGRGYKNYSLHMCARQLCQPYLREDVHTHKEENVEEKENQNGPCYIDSNVKTDDKYDPVEKKIASKHDHN